MLKILIEFIVQACHENSFFVFRLFVFFPFFDRFRPILYRLIDLILCLSTSEKSMCVLVCVLRVLGDLINS